MSSPTRSSESLYNRRLSRVLNLALSLSMLISSALPGYAVGSPPQLNQEEDGQELQAKPAESLPEKAEESTAKEEEPKQEEKSEKKKKKEKKKKEKKRSKNKAAETESEPEPEASPASETTEVPAPEPVQEAEPKPETKSESEAEPEAQPESESESQSETPTETGTETETETESEEPVTKSDPGVKKPEHISEADMLLLKNKLVDAEKAYRALLEDDENGDAYAGLAVALAKQKNPKKVIEAEGILRKCKDEFRENPNMMAAAGLVAFEHSKTVASPSKRDLYLDAAENLCEKAIETNEDIVIAQQTLGLVKLSRDEPDSAEEPFKKCYQLAQDKVNGTYLAQAMLRVNPKSKKAAALVEEVLEIDPEYSPIKLQKAIVLTNSGKHEEAFTELHSIPREDRESEWYKVQGDIYRKQGDGNSAVASWKESIRRDPRNADPYKKLAEHYMLRGDGELAIAEMHSALEILPNDIKLRQQLAELALRLDKLEVAEQEFRTILSVKQNDPSALLGLARVFFRKARREGQYPQEWVQLKEKLQDVIEQRNVIGTMVPKDAATLQEKVDLAEAEKALTQKQFRDAGRYFRKVIDKHKEDAFQLLTLAEQAFNDGDLKTAELAYSYAREIPEVAPRAEQGISKITSQRKEAERQVKLGDATEKKLPDVAEDHYKQSLIADPQGADAYYNLFFLYMKEKKDSIEPTIEYGENFLEASEDSDNRRQQVEKLLFKLKERLRKENSK
ncbi:MAG: tetratricopeptide repeat protein [Cyanobacteriota/Melainabacteria group bacterium]